MDRSSGRCWTARRGSAATCSRRTVDLSARVAAREPTSLDTFVEDTATIVAMELAQVRLLEEVFEVPVREARLSFGHSIGELSALVLGGVYEMEQLLPIPLSLAHDCADLTADTTMGILSSPSGTLEPERVQRLCSAISSRGPGWSGRRPTSRRTRCCCSARATRSTCSRPRCGTTCPRPSRCGAGPITGRRCTRPWSGSGASPTARRWRSITPAAAISSRSRTVVSCTTGRANYDEWNSREILTEWTDHPQRLWDAIEHTLGSGVDLVIHVGPEPKLIPTTFERLSGKVMKQLKNRHLDSLGRRVLPSISRNHWLARSCRSRRSSSAPRSSIT